LLLAYPNFPHIHPGVKNSQSHRAPYQKRLKNYDKKYKNPEKYWNIPRFQEINKNRQSLKKIDDQNQKKQVYPNDT
jgi:hypothetical protein